jgi:hypothetical protein
MLITEIRAAPDSTALVLDFQRHPRPTRDGDGTNNQRSALKQFGHNLLFDMDLRMHMTIQSKDRNMA